MKTLETSEAQELPDLKRRMARCLTFLAFWGILSIPVILFVAPWFVVTAASTAAFNAPWWVGPAMLPMLLATFRIVEFLWLCIRLASTLREPNTVSLWEFVRVGWAAYFSTDQTLDAKTILEIGAERWAIEEMFHDVKEVWGAGQQQVRNVWSSIGCWHLNTWLYSLVELACWDRPAAALVDRSDRSWDNPSRRPSHADRRRQIRREMLEQQFLTHLPPDLKKTKFLDRLHQLLALAA